MGRHSRQRVGPDRGAVGRLLVSHALASVGMAIPWPLLLVLVWEHARSDVLLGVAGAARMVPYVLLSWWVGRLADRHSKTLLVRVSLLGRVLALAVVGWAIGSPGAENWQLGLAAATVAVVLGTPAYPAQVAALPTLVRGDPTRATTALVTVEVMSFVVGPAVGGLLLVGPLRSLGPWLAVASVIVALILVYPVVLDDRNSRRRHRADRLTAGASPRARLAPVLRESRTLWLGFAAVIVVNLVGAVVSVGLLPLSEEVWRDGGAGFGIATSVFGFGGVAAPLLIRLAGTDDGRVRVGMTLLASGCLGVALAPAVGWSAVPLVLVGAASVLVEAAAAGLFQQAAPESMRASVFGLADSVMVAAAALGAFVTPALARLLGPRQLFVLVGLVVLAAGLVPLGMAVRRRARADVPAESPRVATPDPAAVPVALA